MIEDVWKIGLPPEINVKHTILSSQETVSQLITVENEAFLRLLSIKCIGEKNCYWPTPLLILILPSTETSHFIHI